MYGMHKRCRGKSNTGLSDLSDAAALVAAWLACVESTTDKCNPRNSEYPLLSNNAGTLSGVIRVNIRINGTHNSNGDSIETDTKPKWKKKTKWKKILVFENIIF